MNESLLVPIFKSFSHLSKNTLISFVRNLKLDPANDITMNLVINYISLLACYLPNNILNILIHVASFDVGKNPVKLSSFSAFSELLKANHFRVFQCEASLD